MNLTACPRTKSTFARSWKSDRRQISGRRTKETEGKCTRSKEKKEREEQGGGSAGYVGVTNITSDSVE